MSQSFASTALVMLGTVITVLGLFVGGGIQLIVVGLVAIVAGGVIEVASRAASGTNSNQPG